MSLLTAEDHAFWEENGYVIVRKVVPQDNLDAVVDALWTFLGMDPQNPDSWYSAPEWHRSTGMVELYHHQAMWDNRQYPTVHQAFSEIYGTEKLWVSMDRVNMNPPATPERDYEGFIHWDMDPTQWPSPLRVQGVLCLTDTSADQGGFQCVPGSHKRVQEIVAQQKPDQNPRVPDTDGLTIKPVVANAGDLVIWNTALLHGNGRNNSDRPRLAQYITMYPAQADDETARQQRIEQWQKCVPPQNKRAFPGDPRRLEEKRGECAKLTPLGEKLLGLQSWA